MELEKFFKKHNLKPTPWAEKKNISASVISRYLNGKGISPENALKVVNACNGEVTLDDIYSRESNNQAA